MTDSKDEAEKASSLPPTELVFLSYDGNFELTCEATVLSCEKESSSSSSSSSTSSSSVWRLVLDRSVVYPQGGGQPSDHATVRSLSSSSGETGGVTRASLDRGSGVATHLCDRGFAAGERVRVSVAAERRRLLSECQTAGHVVDAAMARVGLEELPATKGYHFPEGPYVEYRGTLPEGRDKTAVLEELKEAFRAIVDEDASTEIRTRSKDDAQTLLGPDFDLGPYGADVRLVTVAGLTCPCGGTHVKTTADLKERGWEVVGIRNKKGVFRVRYDRKNKD